MSSKPKLSGREAALKVLEQADGPLHVKEIYERVQAQYTTGLKGKTPIATLGAQLYVLSKKDGGPVRALGKGMFQHTGETVADATQKEASKLARQASPDPKPASKNARKKQRQHAHA